MSSLLHLALWSTFSHVTALTSTLFLSWLKSIPQYANTTLHLSVNPKWWTEVSMFWRLQIIMLPKSTYKFCCALTFLVIWSITEEWNYPRGQHSNSVKLLFTEAAIISHPTSNVSGLRFLNFFISSPTFCIIFLFAAILVGVKWLSHCGFDFYFSSN